MPEKTTLKRYKKAYSYIRYSSKEQSKGDSYRRQFAKTKEFCDKNNYELDNKVSIYQDLGKSAFKDEQERLKKFIQDCESGIIEKGSLLIVENLDRLSRKKVNTAMSQFLQMLEFVDIYSLQEEKLYTNNDDNESQKQLIDIITSLLIMSRAHEESLAKKKRLLESWSFRRSNIDKIKINTKYPHWLKINEDQTGFIVKEDRLDIIKKIFEFCIKGNGQDKTVKYLNNNIDKLPTPTDQGISKTWSKATVAKILKDRRLLGEHQFYKSEGKKRVKVGELLLNYYPKLINEETFLKAQISLNERRLSKGRINTDKFSNIFRQIMFCAECKNTLEYTHKGSQKNSVYLTCTTAKRSNLCSSGKHFRYAELELMLMHLLAENDFIKKPSTSNVNLKIELERLQIDKKTKSAKLELLIENDFDSEIMIKKIKSLDDEIKEISGEIKEIERRLNEKVASFSFEELKSKILDEEDKDILFDNRLKLNNILSDKIKKAYIINHNNNIFINFEMRDDEHHQVLLEKNYKLGACTLSNKKIVEIRLREGVENEFIGDDEIMELLSANIFWFYSLKNNKDKIDKSIYDFLESVLNDVSLKIGSFTLKAAKIEDVIRLHKKINMLNSVFTNIESLTFEKLNRIFEDQTNDFNVKLSFKMPNDKDLDKIISKIKK